MAIKNIFVKFISPTGEEKCRNLSMVFALDKKSDGKFYVTLKNVDLDETDSTNLVLDEEFEINEASYDGCYGILSEIEYEEAP